MSWVKVQNGARWESDVIASPTRLDVIDATEVVQEPTVMPVKVMPKVVTKKKKK